MPTRNDPENPTAKGKRTDLCHVASDGTDVEWDLTYINGQSVSNRKDVAKYGPRANGVTRASAKEDKHKKLVEADNHRFLAFVINEFGEIIKGHKGPIMEDLGDMATSQAPMVYEYPQSFLRQLQARLFMSTITGTCNLVADARRILFRDRCEVRRRNMLRLDTQ